MNYTINFEKYEKILDVLLDSKFDNNERRKDNNMNKKFKCYVACK